MEIYSVIFYNSTKTKQNVYNTQVSIFIQNKEIIDRARHDVCLALENHLTAYTHTVVRFKILWLGTKKK